jgi:hypothetical protein
MADRVSFLEDDAYRAHIRRLAAEYVEAEESRRALIGEEIIGILRGDVIVFGDTCRNNAA